MQALRNLCVSLIVLGVGSEAMPMLRGQEVPLDVQTSFEFTDLDGRFLVGSCPGCAVFENGEARATNNPSLSRNGSNAWLIPPASTGTITFEVPVRDLKFYFKDEDESVASHVMLQGEEGVLLLSVVGSANGPAENGFTEVALSGSSVKKVSVVNPLPEGGIPRNVVLEDLEASFHPAELTLVDTFYFSRFGDGVFVLEGTPNTFITEALLINQGGFARVSVDVFDDFGTPIAITLEDRTTQNRTTDSSFLFELQPGESMSVATGGLGSGSEALALGYWRVRVERIAGAGEIHGVAVFSRLQDGEVLLFEAGVPATRPVFRFSILMDSTGERDTGLAFINPADGLGPATVTLKVRDLQLEDLLAEAQLSVPEGESISRFIWEYVRDFGNAPEEVIVALREAQAVVVVTSDKGIVPMALRQNNPAAVFPEAVPTLTTVPVATALSAP